MLLKNISYIYPERWSVCTENLPLAPLPRTVHSGSAVRTRHVISFARKTRDICLKKPLMPGDPRINSSHYVVDTVNLRRCTWLKIWWKRAMEDRISCVPIRGIRVPFGCGAMFNQWCGRAVTMGFHVQLLRSRKRASTRVVCSLPVQSGRRTRVDILNGFPRKETSRCSRSTSSCLNNVAREAERDGTIIITALII